VSAGLIKFDEFTLDTNRFELLRAGRSVKLEKIPMEFLILLASKDGHLVTRQEIIERLWGRDVFVDTEHGINTAVRKIRRALREDAEQPRFVQTIPGKGYRLVVPGRLTQDNGNGNGSQGLSGKPISVSEDHFEIEAANAGAEQPDKPLRKSRAMLLTIACAALVVLPLVWLFRPSLPAPRIIGANQLTSDGLWKWGPIATDGIRVYFTEEKDGHSIIASVPVTGGQSVPIQVPFRDAAVLSISPDRSDLLVAASHLIDEAPLWRVPIVGGTPRRIGNVIGHDLSMSRDGKKLAYTTGSDIYIADADGNNPRKLLPTNADPGVWAWRPLWSPDGKRLRFDYYQMAEHESKTWEVNPDGSNPHRLLSPSADPPMYGYSDWTPDGKYFVFSAWKDLVSGNPWPASNLWALRERTDIFHQPSAIPVALTNGPTHYFTHTLSPDGKTIFASSVMKHGELVRYITRTKAFEPFLSGLSAEGVAFSADHQWVAYVKYPQGELWRSKADGSEPLQLTFRPLFVLDPSWSPDGKQLAFAGQRAGEKWQLYTVSMDGGTTKVIPTSDPALGSSWSSDGSSLVFVNAGKPAGDINLLDLRSGKISDLSDSHDLFFPRWSPDGRYVAAQSSSGHGFMVLDLETKRWSEWAHGPDIAWLRWSRRGNYIYFSGAGDQQRIYRIGTKNRKIEQVLDLRDFRLAGAVPHWFSLTPDDDLLFLRNTGGGTELYALPWEAP